MNNDDILEVLHKQSDQIGELLEVCERALAEIEKLRDGNTITMEPGTTTNPTI